jgi:hypothetical protein
LRTLKLLSDGVPFKGLYDRLLMLEVLLEGSPEECQVKFVEYLVDVKSGLPLIESLRDLLRGNADEVTVKRLFEIHRRLWNADRLGLLSIATTDNSGEFGYNVDPPRDFCFARASRDNFQFGGTSAAAAQVAGVVALMLSAVLEKTGSVEDVNRILRPDVIRELLRTSANPNGLQPEASGREFGFGLLNAKDAVAAASSYVKDQRQAA